MTTGQEGLRGERHWSNRDGRYALTNGVTQVTQCFIRHSSNQTVEANVLQSQKLNNNKKKTLADHIFLKSLCCAFLKVPSEGVIFYKGHTHNFLKWKVSKTC